MCICMSMKNHVDNIQQTVNVGHLGGMLRWWMDPVHFVFMYLRIAVVCFHDKHMLYNLRASKKILKWYAGSVPGFIFLAYILV